MYYHASQIKDIKVLEPRKSNHNIPLVYLSAKRENTLVYLSNAVEKFCKEKGFQHEGVWSKWGPYGFDSHGILQYEEYYPNALEETYGGVGGYIYSCEKVEEDTEFELRIPDAIVSSKEVEVTSCEIIYDALTEILRAEESGQIRIVRYNDFIVKREKWLSSIIQSEFSESSNHPEYQFFLKQKFAKYLE